VQVTNLAGFFADPVAESALAGILAHFRGIDRLVRLQDHGEWQ
jgi:phosphoglycerate dehydrogenase-like enzyme